MARRAALSRGLPTIARFAHGFGPRRAPHVTRALAHLPTAGDDDDDFDFSSILGLALHRAFATWSGVGGGGWQG